MTKEEFMVGNIVELLTSNLMINLPTGKYGVIEEIREDKVKIRYNYESAEGFCFFNRKYDTIIPIKLSEEIILRLGFEYSRTDKSNVYKKHNFRISYVFEGKYTGQSFLSYANITFVESKYFDNLHLFQNLYYGLTNEKLTFKSKENETDSSRAIG